MVETPLHSDPFTGKIIAEAMHVHSVLGPGFLETIYQNALLIRLKKAGLRLESRKTLPVHFEGEIVGDFIADIVIEDRLILALKAVPVLTSAHETELVNFLTAARIDIGLLINFGANHLEVKRKSRTIESLVFPVLPVRTASRSR